MEIGFQGLAPGHHDQTLVSASNIYNGDGDEAPYTESQRRESQDYIDIDADQTYTDGFMKELNDTILSGQDELSSKEDDDEGLAQHHSIGQDCDWTGM